MGKHDPETYLNYSLLSEYLETKNEVNQSKNDLAMKRKNKSNIFGAKTRFKCVQN